MVMAMAMAMGSYPETMDSSARTAKLSVRATPAFGLRRLAIVLLIAILLWSTARAAFVAIARASNPSAAVTAMSNDPVALAGVADGLLAKGDAGPDQASDLRRAAGLARKSLEEQALNPRALRILGFATSGNQPQSRLLVNLATRLSRRELGAHLWLIEDSVARENTTGALKHYDLALSTSAEGRKVLIPILVGAIDDDQIRAALAPYVRRNRPWVAEFFFGALPRKARPLSLARLVEEAGGWPKGGVFAGLSDGLMSELIADGELGAAKRLFLRKPGADAALFTSASLSSRSFSDDQKPFAWQAFGSSSAGLSFVNNEKGGAEISIFAGPNEKSLVARKLLLLGPGAYAIGLKTGAVQVSNGGNLKLSVACLGTGVPTPIFTEEYDQVSSDDALIGEFSVLPGCEAQYLAIEIAGGQGQIGSEMVLTSLSVEKRTP